MTAVAPLRIRLVPDSAPTVLTPVRNPVPPAPGAQPAASRLIDRPGAPSPVQVAASIVSAVVEVQRGRRPVTQLVRWLSPRLYTLIAESAPAFGVYLGPPVRIRRVRPQLLQPTSCEASVVLQDGDRVRAAAIRLEYRRDAWRAVALVIG